MYKTNNMVQAEMAIKWTVWVSKIARPAKIIHLADRADTPEPSDMSELAVVRISPIEDGFGV